MSRIGIFAGTFDPVHKGHLTLALKTAESAELDMIYFLPEALPRGKQHVTHISHRLAMLQLATRPHSKLGVLDLPDKQFTMARTWPRIRQRFGGDKLLLLMGADVFDSFSDWPHKEALFEDGGIIVATKGQRDIAHSLKHVMDLEKPLWEVHMVESDYPHASSRLIRTAVAAGGTPETLVYSVRRYIGQNWLYVDVRTIVAQR